MAIFSKNYDKATINLVKKILSNPENTIEPDSKTSHDALHKSRMSGYETSYVVKSKDGKEILKINRRNHLDYHSAHSKIVEKPDSGREYYELEMNGQTCQLDRTAKGKLFKMAEKEYYGRRTNRTPREKNAFVALFSRFVRE